MQKLQYLRTFNIWYFDLWQSQSQSQSQPVRLAERPRPASYVRVCMRRGVYSVKCNKVCCWRDALKTRTRVLRRHTYLPCTAQDTHIHHPECTVLQSVSIQNMYKSQKYDNILEEILSNISMFHINRFNFIFFVKPFNNIYVKNFETP